jgi:hypothetical protein
MYLDAPSQHIAECILPNKPQQNKSFIKIYTPYAFEFYLFLQAGYICVRSVNEERFPVFLLKLGQIYGNNI